MREEIDEIGDANEWDEDEEQGAAIHDGEMIARIGRDCAREKEKGTVDGPRRGMCALTRG
jgi:hypothetical protein